MKSNPYSYTQFLDPPSQAPNLIPSLGAAIALLFHAGRRWRGTSEFFRSAISVTR
jgi:hypothetical protein